MGVYLPIDKPGMCSECPIAYNGVCVLNLNLGRKDMDITQYCLLMEVKAPHGRLIDKDALEEDISRSVVFSGKKWNPEIIGANKIMDRIHRAPDIIPEEKVQMADCEGCSMKKTCGNKIVYDLMEAVEPGVKKKIKCGAYTPEKE